MAIDEWIQTDLSIAEADLDRLRERLADAENEAKSLRAQLAASLKLQTDLADENVRLREALVEIAPIAETLNKNISVWEFLPTFYRALSLNLLASIKAIAAKALEGK